MVGSEAEEMRGQGRRKGNIKGKGSFFLGGWHVADTTRLINLWPSVRTSYLPPLNSSVNGPFYGYSKLQLHGTEENRNRRRSNDGD